jgi:hypothetical protein
MGARIEAVAAQNFTPAGHGGSLLFATTPNNSINYPTDRMIIDQNGQVGIGVFPPNYALDVLGDVNSSTALWVQGIRVCTSGGCTAASDQRLKKNIKPLPDSLTSLLKLQAVSYDWIDPEKFGKGPQVGLIAQEVEKVYPQVVVTEPKTGMKGIAYDHLVAPVIEAIRAVVAKISALENHIADLLKASEEHSRDIALLKSRLEKAERENAAQRIYFCSKDPSAPFCH